MQYVGVHWTGSNGTTNTWSAGRVTSHITRTWQQDTLVKVFILAVLISCFAQEWKPGLTWKFLYGSGLTHKTQNRTRRICTFSCSLLISSFPENTLYGKVLKQDFWLVNALVTSDTSRSDEKIHTKTKLKEEDSFFWIKIFFYIKSE